MTHAHQYNGPAAGVTRGDGALFVGTQFAVYRVPYQTGDQRVRGAPVKLACVRTSGVSSDHHTTTVALVGDTLFASVGSPCNACRPELDDTRATIQRIDLHTGKVSVEARNLRNAIALAGSPETRAVRAGVVGADDPAALSSLRDLRCDNVARGSGRLRLARVLRESKTFHEVVGIVRRQAPSRA